MCVGRHDHIGLRLHAERDDPPAAAARLGEAALVAERHDRQIRGRLPRERVALRGGVFGHAGIPIEVIGR
ncbi:MAG: hypothetical protein V9E86_08875 [Nitrosomonas sp.]